MKIYAPVKETNGVYASVMFKNGVGITDNPNLIKWFENHGYRTEEERPVSKIIEDVLEISEEPPEKTFEDMSPIELREWLIDNGYASMIRNIRNKEKLLEIIREVTHGQ